MSAPQAGSPFPEELEPLADDYEYIREIGAGGMAAVYLARERDGGRLVAIKAIRRRYLEDEEALSRFAREARVLADLHHPNIVETYAVRPLGEKSLAIVMQHLSGGTLRQLLRREGQLSFEQSSSILRDVAEALRQAHSQGVVHRDVKPENIFLEEGTGRAILSDFGIARPMVESEEENELTLVGAAIGTPAYMSPEQIDGLALDGRTDIYSLGLVGWEMLSGSRPWEGENLYGIIYKQKHEELQRLPELRPDIPTPLLFAIEGALDKHRDTRWADIDEFLAQLCEPAPAEKPRPRVHLVKDSAAKRLEEKAVERQEIEEEQPADEAPAPWLEAAKLETPSSIFSQWGFVHPEDRSALPFDELEELDEPEERPVARPGWPRWVGARRLSPRLVVAGALSIVLVLAAVLALDAGRGAPDGNAATLAPDSGATAVTAGALQTDSAPSATAQEPPRDSAAATPARPSPAAATPTREATVPATRRVVARSHLDSLLLCDSPVQTHQRACLFAHISDKDTALNRVYRELIAELRTRAGASAGRGEPESVSQLRGEQREWLSWRDQECRRRSRENEGELWAPVRARCFAEFSNARTKELSGQLSRLRGG